MSARNFAGGSLFTDHFPPVRPGGYERQPSGTRRDPLKFPAKERFLVFKAQGTPLVYVQLTGEAG